MKETIYTIPVNEAFETPCECPLCRLVSRFEADRVNYYLGPSLMEPENRIETNESGFCARHFRLMYETRANRLGLGLMIQTHMSEQNSKIEKAAGIKNEIIKKPSKSVETLLKYIDAQQRECCICRDLDKTMERYCEVITHMYFSEDEFKKHFDAGLGFCMPHFAMLIRAAEKNLYGGRKDTFLQNLISMQISNLKRIESEVEWFTKKFDYRNKDADWGNSRDAVSRSIEKLTGLTGLEES